MASTAREPRSLFLRLDHSEVRQRFLGGGVSAAVGGDSHAITILVLVIFTCEMASRKSAWTNVSSSSFIFSSSKDREYSSYAFWSLWRWLRSSEFALENFPT